LAGYGLLGFATVKEQHSAADGSPLTTATSYLQDGAYIGVAGVTQTLDGALNQSGAAVISRTTNSYCDTTSTASPIVISAGGTSPVACATTSLVQRPYLYQTFEEGWDIDSNRTALPTVTTTNTFDGSGDATNIVVTIQGTSVGVGQMVTKTTSNVFYPDTTAGDSWILGRLNTSTQTNTVPNLLGSISTSAGTGAHATATSGVSPSATLSASPVAGTTVGQSSTATATLTNTSAGALGVTVPTVSSVGGTDFSFGSTTCTGNLAQSAACTVTIQFSPTAALTRTGSGGVEPRELQRELACRHAGVGQPDLHRWKQRAIGRQCHPVQVDAGYRERGGRAVKLRRQHGELWDGDGDHQRHPRYLCRKPRCDACLRQPGVHAVHLAGEHGSATDLERLLVKHVRRDAHPGVADLRARQLRTNRG